MLLNRKQIDVALRGESINRPLMYLREALKLPIIGRHNRHGRVSNLLQLANVNVVLVLLSLR